LAKIKTAITAYTWLVVPAKIVRVPLFRRSPSLFLGRRTKG